jgi:hypothetical protein
MEFDPIILKYDGLDASDHRLDLGQIGRSLHGAAQLLGTAASIVSTGEYAKRSTAMPVRILAGTPRTGSWEIPAIIVSTLPALGQSSLFAEFSKQLATQATTKIVSFVLTTFDKKPKPPSESQLMLETVQKAMAEVGHTSRHAIDAVVRMAEQQRPAMRELVIPIGLTCETLMVGSISNGAIPIDRDMRAAIDAPIEVDVEGSKRHEIMISEMDRVNQTCKFGFRNDGNSERRITGQITDPIIQTPSDPYSAAFSEQRWITVVGKLQIKGGEPDKLFISDIVGS